MNRPVHSSLEHENSYFVVMWGWLAPPQPTPGSAWGPMLTILRNPFLQNGQGTSVTVPSVRNVNDGIKLKVARDKRTVLPSGSRIPISEISGAVPIAFIRLLLHCKRATFLNYQNQHICQCFWIDKMVFEC